MVSGRLWRNPGEHLRAQGNSSQTTYLLGIVTQAPSKTSGAVIVLVEEFNWKSYGNLVNLVTKLKMLAKTHCPASEWP